MTSNGTFSRLEILFHELEALDADTQALRIAEIAAEDESLATELADLLALSPSLARKERVLEQMAEEGGLSSNLAESSDPAWIGPYRLVRKLGEGGMGRVYLAEQSEPVQRMVALKLIRRGFNSAEAKTRFKSERQAMAALDHPHIARVFDAGSTKDGRPWFAMEYIDGMPITTWAAKRGLGLIERIQLLLPVCDAIQHAHRKGLIHRDLKPSNILVIDDGDLGFAKLIDFGIARTVDVGTDARSQVTQLGELVGTPEYMSPEQAALGALDIDTRSDVYALGLLLYELLVGQLPVSGKELRALGFEAMCRKIREGETPRPSRYRAAAGEDPLTGRWRARLKGDLDAVLLKALAKDREHRYGSASELADDLKRYLDNEPVLAQPPSLAYRASKFVRRHRWPVAASAAVLLAVLVGAVMALYGQQRARAALEQAEINLAEARLLNDISNAYADALQRIFGASDDIERNTRLLLSHVQERAANADTDPDSAALATFAVGRHFLSRNDYPTARKVFEPWLQAGYGPQELRSYGWQLLGFAYRHTGEPGLALKAFREAGRLAHSYRADHPGVVSRSVQIALLSGDPADIESARVLLHKLLSKDTLVGASRMGVLNSLFLLESRIGNMEAAYRAISEAVAVIDANPGMEFAGQDTNRLNLASMEIFERGDLEAGWRQLETIRNGLLATKGANRESGRALLLEGVLLRARGDLEASLARLEQSIPVLERFAGARSGMRRHAELERIVTLLKLGRTEEAERRMQAFSELVGADPDRRLAIARAYVALDQGDREAATQWLASVNYGKQGGAGYIRYHLRQLQAAGVTLPVAL